MTKTNLAQQLRSNLLKRKQQKSAHTPAFLIAGKPEATLQGAIDIAGAKNAALPMMIAAALTSEKVELDNLPNLTDIAILKKIMAELGVAIEQNDKSMSIEAREITTSMASPSLVKQMRASFWVLAPLLLRTGKAQVFLPGGDNIGARGVDIYLEGLKAFGADVSQTSQRIDVAAKKLHGTKFELHFPSVGATHVLLMIAAMAQGESKLLNVAKEPEVIALAQMLQQMGAHIDGLGSNELTIQGVEQLHGARCSIPSDRIEAGTYLIAAALCGGSVQINNAPVDELKSLLEKLMRAEIEFSIEANAIKINRDKNQTIAPVDITTEPYPAFPTDLQAQWSVLMTQANGKSKITETLFENRFQHIPELQKLGAGIQLDGRCALIEGKTPLFGADVQATDIRASACLVLAGLIAEGETCVQNIFHLERGFEAMELKLNACGAAIQKISFDE